MKSTVALVAAIAFLSPPVVAQESHQSEGVRQCQSALLAAANRIVAGRNLQIVRASLYDVSAPPDLPQVSMGVAFRLAGRDAENMMFSPQLLTSISRDIITGCAGIGVVTFNVDQTDWSQEYGLVNGRVQAFQCVDPGPEVLEWGTTACP